MDVELSKKEYASMKRQAKGMVQELTEHAEEFLLKEYGIELAIPIEVNGRLTSTLGYFSRTTGGVPVKISISERLVIGCLVKMSFEPLYDVLRHELVHYALFSLGRNFADGDDDFEGELARLGVSSSGSTRASKVKSFKIDYNILIRPIFTDGVNEFLINCGVSRKEVSVDGQIFANTGRVSVIWL